jgi:hypothetical protein
VNQKPSITPKPPIEAKQADARSNLLDSIKGFKGFQEKPAVHHNTTADVLAVPIASETSILDQLKLELVKRAQFFQSNFF